jgi:hypothetical protein
VHCDEYTFGANNFLPYRSTNEEIVNIVVREVLARSPSARRTDHSGTSRALRFDAVHERAEVRELCSSGAKFRNQEQRVHASLRRGQTAFVHVFDDQTGVMLHLRPSTPLDTESLRRSAGALDSKRRTALKD